MLIKDTRTNTYYEGGLTYASSIIGVKESTIWRWKQKGLKEEVFNHFVITFTDVVREKQLKGFALKNNRKNIYHEHKRNSY